MGICEVEISAGLAPLRRLRQAFSAVVPPVALGGGEMGVASLGDGGVEGVQDADVVVPAGYCAQAVVQLLWLVSCELIDGSYSEQLEVTQHGRADGGEVFELAMRFLP